MSGMNVKEYFKKSIASFKAQKKKNSTTIKRIEREKK